MKQLSKVIFFRSFFSSKNDLKRNSEVFSLLKMITNRIPRFFLFRKWFLTEFQGFSHPKMFRNGIPRVFLLCEMVWNGILRVFLFRENVWNGILRVFLYRELVWNGILRVFLFRENVRNGIPRVFLFRELVRNGIPRVFSSENWFGMEFRGFFSSAKQAKFRRNCCLFRLVPYSAE
jgi:hypothetical protein